MAVRRVLAAAAMAIVGAGLVVAFRPLHANGLRGSAVRPHYTDFGWFSYTPMPAQVTVADLRRAGVRTPYDVVDERRRLAGGVVAAGLILAGAVATASVRAASDG